MTSVTLDKFGAHSADLYRGMLETLYLKQSPETEREIQEGLREDWKTGEVYNPDEEW